MPALAQHNRKIAPGRVDARTVVAISLVEDVLDRESQVDRITDAKLAEEAVRKSEEKYSTLVESSLTGIYIDQSGKVVFANSKYI